MPNPLLDRLNTKTVVIGLTVSRPRFTYKVESGKIIVGGDSDATELTTGTQWRVIPDNHAKNLAVIERSAREIIKTKGVALLKGIYVVPVTRIENLFREFDDVKAEYRTAASNLVYDWDSIINGFFERIKTKCNGSSGPIIEELKKRIPKSDNLLEKFDMSILHFPFGNDGMVSPEAAEKLNSDLVERMNASAQRVVEQTIVNLFTEPRNELLQSIEKVTRAIEDRHSVRESSLDLLKRSYGRLQDFSFMLPGEMQQKLAQLGEHIDGFSGSSMSDGEARAALTGYLGEVKQNLDMIEQIEAIPVMRPDAVRPIAMDF